MWNQEDFINRVQKMAIDNQTNLKAITREIGISNSSFTDWKKGRGIPSVEKFCKIADYFSVSLDFLAYGIDPYVQTDISSRKDAAFNSKFNKLPADLQSKVLSYMDGMLATLEDSEQEKRLSS